MLPRLRIFISWSCIYSRTQNFLYLFCVKCRACVLTTLNRLNHSSPYISWPSYIQYKQNSLYSITTLWNENTKFPREKETFLFFPPSNDLKFMGLLVGHDCTAFFSDCFYKLLILLESSWPQVFSQCKLPWLAELNPTPSVWSWGSLCKLDVAWLRDGLLHRSGGGDDVYIQLSSMIKLAWYYCFNVKVKFLINMSILLSPK